MLPTLPGGTWFWHLPDWVINAVLINAATFPFGMIAVLLPLLLALLLSNRKA